MAPLVADDVYRIHNAKFPNLVADLVHCRPDGIILASQEDVSSKSQLWRVKNIGNGGNQIIIENVCAARNFINGDEVENSLLVGNSQPTLWTVVKVDGGNFYLQTEDGNFVWEVRYGYKDDKIVLLHHTGQENQKWTFERVKQ